MNVPAVTWLEKTDEIFYTTERGGWRHLDLIDAKDGTVKNAVMTGEFVLRGVDRIDEEKREIWFRASGKVPGQDPYFIHYYRVKFDGTELTALTEGNGNHTVQYSPDSNYLIDTYSRVDAPPAHALRRVADGSLVCNLEDADISALKSSAWKAPEVFVAKGRDGKTDIWGIICRPKNFDPKKTYPVIEQIYAGPQGSFVPKSFSPARRFSTLTDLGFISWYRWTAWARPTVPRPSTTSAGKTSRMPDSQIGSSGTKPQPRSIPGMTFLASASTAGRLVARTRPGVCSFTPNSTRSRSRAAVAMTIGWTRRHGMNNGWAIRSGHSMARARTSTTRIGSAASSLSLSASLITTSRLESTMRLADALIKAGKDFDMLIVPGAGHGMGGAYGQRRLEDFFVRHLLGGQPADHNAEKPRASGVARAEAGSE